MSYTQCDLLSAHYCHRDPLILSHIHRPLPSANHSHSSTPLAYHRRHLGRFQLTTWPQLPSLLWLGELAGYSRGHLHVDRAHQHEILAIDTGTYIFHDAPEPLAGALVWTGSVVVWEEVCFTCAALDRGSPSAMAFTSTLPYTWYMVNNIHSDHACAYRPFCLF
jgi:hypothetical protein